MQRWLPALLLAAFLPLATPPGGAQNVPAAPAEVALLQDSSTDCTLHVNDQTQPCGSPWTSAELTALSALETLDTVQFKLTVAGLQNTPETPFIQNTLYGISFRVRDEVYRAVAFRQAGVDAPFYFAQLEQYDAARNRFNPIAGADVKAEGASLTVTVERGLLLDSQGNPPTPGLPLTDFSVTAGGLFTDDGGGPSDICIAGTCSPFPSAEVRDRMPDAGNGTVALSLLYGIAQSGQARLYSDVPIRSSNGEATTFVYQVRGFNLQGKAERYELATVGVPAGWEVRLPAKMVDIKGNSSILFPVLVTTPFAHQHGVLQAFVLELRSTHDAATVGRIQLGVRYAQPPQPAGHHNLLTLHSLKNSFGPLSDGLNSAFGGTQASLFMNAAADDPLDGHFAVEGNRCGQELGGNPPLPRDRYCWDVALSPALDIGLDFDLAGDCQGPCQLKVPFTTLEPLPAAQLSGELVYYPPGEFDPRFGFSFSDPVVLGELVPDPPKDLAANTADQQLVATLQVNEAADYIPYAKGATLALQLLVTGVGANFFISTPAQAPKLQTGQTSQLTLPLVEYHDRVDGVFASASSLALVANSEQDRLVNPGKTVLFNLTLENSGPASTFQLDLTGVHLAWSGILDPADTMVELGANQTRTIAVRVTVPDDAKQDEAADLVLSATDTADLNIRSVARLVARVDTAADHPDDAALAQAVQDGAGKKGTPGLELVAAVAALGAALVLARRRRLA